MKHCSLSLSMERLVRENFQSCGKQTIGGASTTSAVITNYFLS